MSKTSKNLGSSVLIHWNLSFLSGKGVTPLGVKGQQFITPKGVTLNLKKFIFQCSTDATAKLFYKLSY
jgi:hypothetical protein